MSRSGEQLTAEVIALIAEHLQEIDPSVPDAEAVESAKYLHDLVLTMIDRVIENNPRPTPAPDEGGGVIDASNPTQVDLFGGPLAIRKEIPDVRD